MAVTRLHILNMVILAVAGVVILVLSLMTANSIIATGMSTPSAGWKLYLGREILPDNVLYPFLMLRDRVKLDSASSQEQVRLKLEFAEERYTTAQQLLERRQIPLAISTLTKYQKYTISAGYQVLNSESSTKAELEQVHAAAQTSLSRMELFVHENAAHDLGAISQLQEETRVLLVKLDEKLTKL